ncbi:MAG: Ig-like domain-containing protein [Pirellulaceae bacterium]
MISPMLLHGVVSSGLVVSSFDDSITLGSVSNNYDGTFTYDPNGVFEHFSDGESTTDTFTYTVTDSSGAESTATVTINVLGQNHQPQFAQPNYSYNLDENPNNDQFVGSVALATLTRRTMI